MAEINKADSGKIQNNRINFKSFLPGEAIGGAFVVGLL